MLRPVKMSKIRAVCLKAAAPSVIQALHSMSVLHVKDAQFPSIERSGPLPSFDEISSRSIRLKAMKEMLGKKGRPPKRKVEIKNPLKSADELLAGSEGLAEMLRQREAIAKEQDALLSSIRALSEFSGIDVDFSSLHSGSLQFLVFRCGADKAKAAERHLSGRKNCAFVSSAGNGRNSVLLVALPKTEDAKWLEKFGAISPLPRISSTPAREIASLKQDEESLHAKMEAVERKISRFSETAYPSLLAIEEALSLEEDRAEIATRFGASELLYYIEGWAEASKVASIKSELRQKFGRKVSVSESAFDAHHEKVPSKLQNPKQASSFQFLVEFLSTTRYTEIDPTLIVAFTIPLIYALIFGDAGYAVLSFLLATFMRKKSRPGSLLYEVATIWAISAIPAFFAGVAYDEFFGFTHGHLLSLFGFEHMQFYEGLHRVSSITTLMLICIIVGMLHLALGFILGAANEWNHSKKHAIAKLCWLGVEISGFFLVAGLMFSSFPAFTIPAAALMAISVAGMVITEGPVAAIEIPGLASNIMSYIRIAAVGVGGVILAEAINELLLPRFELSPLGIIAFIITAAAYLSVHALSCILAMFESFIHGARLNVVEFFGKFYKGDGVRFAPFSARRLYTQEGT